MFQKKDNLLLSCLLLGAFLLSAGTSRAQGNNIALSAKHQQRLSDIESGHKRLVRYYRYFKRDSTRFRKLQERASRRALDSVWRLEKQQRRLARNLPANHRFLERNQVAADTLDNEIRKWIKISRDTTVTDSARAVAKEYVRRYAVQKVKRYPGFQNLHDQYLAGVDSGNWKKLTDQVPGLDTLSSFFESSPAEVFKVAEQASIGFLEGKVGDLPGQNLAPAELKMIDDLRQKMKQQTDPDNLKRQAKNNAEEFFANHDKELKSAQSKVSRLMSKYRDVPNSDDLSTAVKQTSLKGKSFGERLLINCNFNVVSTKPAAIDLMPGIGYKFTTRFSTGVALSYRFTFSDSIRSNWYISPKTTSVKVFGSYDVLKSFYVYAEYERVGIQRMKSENAKKAWMNNYFVGVGKRFLVHPKIYITITALYNLNNEINNPNYPRRFQIRTGFQISELATRKKQVHFDPNR